MHNEKPVRKWKTSSHLDILYILIIFTHFTFIFKQFICFMLHKLLMFVHSINKFRFNTFILLFRRFNKICFIFSALLIFHTVMLSNRLCCKSYLRLENSSFLRFETLANELTRVITCLIFGNKKKISRKLQKYWASQSLSSMLENQLLRQRYCEHVTTKISICCLNSIV